VNDVIRLTGVRARGHHGVFDHERADGQDFVVDVAVEVDARAASDGDDLERTVHYGVLAEQVVAEIERDPVDLIETLAERIAAAVLSHAAAIATEVTVHKPQAPITVPFDDVSITIRRDRTDVDAAADDDPADDDPTELEEEE
jgi:7,8-dihydroneopterin aldolase/epimerase/oxygenase